MSRIAHTEFFAGSRQLSPKTIMKIAGNLKLNNREIAHLKFISKNKIEESEFVKISDNDFIQISEWYVMAIICYSQMIKNKSSPEHLAKRFGITISEAKKAVEILTRLKIVEDIDGKLIRTGNSISRESA